MTKMRYRKDAFSQHSKELKEVKMEPNEVKMEPNDVDSLALFTNNYLLQPTQSNIS
jgi:hypothetical protein